VAPAIRADWRVGEADSADAEDRDRLALPDLRRVVDRAVAGEDGAAEEGRVGEGDALREGQDTGRRYDRLLGERRHVQAGVEVAAVGGAVGVDVGGAVERVGAEPDLAEGAGVASAAGRGPVEDDRGAR
jgi:hypothetical protein